MSGPDPVASFLEHRVRARWAPGAVWRVEDRTRVMSRGALGSSVVEPDSEAATLETPYDLASLTKVLVTAPLLVLLEQEQVIELGAPVGRYLEELSGSRLGSATLLSLARHSAGLPAWSPLYVEQRTLEGYLRAISALPPAVREGDTLYSDLGYAVLGAVLERVSGRPLGELFEQRIAAPLGLRRTGFAGEAGRFAGAAATERGNAYERRLSGEAGESHRFRTHLLRGEVHDANAHAIGGAAGHAGLFGTVDDVAAVARELLRPERLGLGRRARDRLLETTGSRTVGMVVARASNAARGILPDDAPGHSGFTGTSLWLDPRSERCYVLLTNRVHPAVPERDFQLLRRGFHRAALLLWRP